MFRVTEDPAPRILYAFESTAKGELSIPSILQKVRGGDILGSELVLGGAIAPALGKEEREVLMGAVVVGGVKAACQEVCKRLMASSGKSR